MPSMTKLKPQFNNPVLYIWEEALSSSCWLLIYCVVVSRNFSQEQGTYCARCCQLRQQRRQSLPQSTYNVMRPFLV